MIDFGIKRGIMFVKWRVTKNIRTAYFETVISGCDLDLVEKLARAYTSTSQKIRMLSRNVKPYTAANILYFIEVWEETERNAIGMERNADIHLDHIVPLSYGFKKGINSKLIGSRENLQLISKTENLRKGNSITEEAVILIKKWGHQ